MSSFGSPFGVVLDSCVLYGYPVRDTLLLAAQEGLYHPIWSHQIWEDVLRHLQNPHERKRPMTPAQAAHLLEELERYFPEAFVSGYEDLIPSMTNDPGDRHVLATAVHSGARVIVTFNLTDFPTKALEPYAITAKHPDDFLTDLYDLDPGVMARVIIDQGAALTRNRMTPGQLLDKLERTRIMYSNSGFCVTSVLFPHILQYVGDSEHILACTVRQAKESSTHFISAGHY